MNKTVIAELYRKNSWLRVIEPNRVFHDWAVETAGKVRAIVDDATRARRFSETLTCPKCSSGDVRQSRAKSLREAIRRQLTVTCPYRCAKCGYRGWGPDLNRRSYRVASDADSPALTFQTQLPATRIPAAQSRRDQLDFHALNLPPRLWPEAEATKTAGWYWTLSSADGRCRIVTDYAFPKDSLRCVVRSAN